MSLFQYTTPEKADLITHAGKFHADDVFSTALLCFMFGKKLNLSRVQFVEPDKYPNAIIYDIGQGELDHHQKGGNGFHKNSIPYASFGLVWNKYGQEFCNRMFHDPDYAFIEFEKFVQGIDAYDNGLYHSKDSNIASISKCISLFNPTWDNPSPLASDKAFLCAVEFATSVICNLFEQITASINAREHIMQLSNRLKNNILESDRYIPTKEITAVFKDCNFFIYPSARGGYTIQILDRKLRFSSSICGLSGSDLSSRTGIKTAVFVHSAGFIAVAETIDDVRAFVAWVEKADAKPHESTP